MPQITTQARLRQLISEHLQQHVSEQALSIYLKRNGYSFPRSMTQPAVSCMPHSSPSQVFVKQQAQQPSPTKSISSSQELSHQLPPDFFYNPSSLFLANCPSSSMDSQLGLNTLNFVGHHLNQAPFPGSPIHNLFGNSNDQSPVPGENLESSDISRYLLAEPEENASLAQCSSSSTNNEDFGEAEPCEEKKTHPKVTSQINWKDPVVQWAISEYFDRKIKLQTELRQVIMRRLKRSISENSLSNQGSKLGASESCDSSFKPNQQLLTPTTNGIGSTAGSLSLLNNPNSKFTYYLCSSQNSDHPDNAVLTATHPVVSSNNYLANFHNHHHQHQNGHPPTMVMKSSPLLTSSPLQLNGNSHPMAFVKMNGADGQPDGLIKFNNEIKEEEKPPIRRRINWSNSKVQSAIQDFHDRKILTQARLRAVVEEALGEVVSEQALSIYLRGSESLKRGNPLRRNRSLTHARHLGSPMQQMAARMMQFTASRKMILFQGWSCRSKLERA
uniref:Uncharacterized protein n=1 Tax=Ditylenchus dipsaci TaxID=166011 RepID=A0A915EAD3_9BILA